MVHVEQHLVAESDCRGIELEFDLSSGALERKMSGEGQLRRHDVHDRKLLPLEFLIFLLYPLRTMLEPLRSLRDPGIGWHLTIGRQILETGQIPIADQFSFTATGNEWASFYWLFQVVAAGLEAIGGLPLFAAVAVLLFATIPVLLFRRMVRMGVGSLPAMLFAVVAQIALMSHSVARPHLLTYVFFALLLDRLDRFQSGSAKARDLWWLPLLALLWCNLHGGFVVGLVLTALYALTAGAQFGSTRREEDGRRAIVFGALLAAMAAATLLNPAGPWLHVSILQYLGMESTGQFQEWRGLVFDTDLRTLIIEGLILSFIVLLVTGARLVWIEGVLLVFFLHMALQSNRHVNLFVIVAVPVVARECLAAIERIRPAMGQVLRRSGEISSARALRVALYGSFCTAFLWLAGSGVLPYPDDLDDIYLSTEAAEYIEARPALFTRPFNTDELGGALIYRFWPALQVFVDDRNPVYGDAFLLDEYFPALRAEAGWDAVLDSWEIRAAVVSMDTPVARVLEVSPGWELVHRDDRNAIFLRADELPSLGSGGGDSHPDGPGSRAPEL